MAKAELKTRVHDERDEIPRGSRRRTETERLLRDSEDDEAGHQGGAENVGHAALLKKLGKFTTGVGCLYIKTLADVEKKVLKDLMQASVKRMKQINS